jgi:hypothetical protein
MTKVKSTTGKRKAPTPIQAFEALPDAEKERVVAEFDRESVADTFRPLGPAQRKLWRKAKKMGRPTKGAGAAVVAISVERGLLKQVDALAKRRKVGRSRLFVEAIQAELRGHADRTAKRVKN